MDLNKKAIILSVLFFFITVSYPKTKALADNSLQSDFTGWWYDKTRPGTGVSLEINASNQWFLGWYVFDENGSPCWYTASGKLDNSTTFSGELLQWTGWAWGTNYIQPSFKKVGTVNGVLSRSPKQNIILNWTLENIGSGVLNLTNFMNDMVGNSSDSKDLTGWWYDPAYNGMGFFIEVKGESLFMAWYNYGEQGSPNWLTSSGKFLSDSLYTGSLSYWQNGQTPNGPYKEPQEIDSQEKLKLTFINSAKAVLELNNSYTLNLKKFFRTWSVKEKDDILEIGYGVGVSSPQYAALHLDSGYFRMTYSENSAWGTSVIVMPSFWEDGVYYQGSPIKCEHTITESGNLEISYRGKISGLSVRGTILLLPPNDNFSSAIVTVHVTGNLNLDNRPGEAFKPVFLSSMHISETQWDAHSAFIGTSNFRIPFEGWIVSPPIVSDRFGLKGGSSLWKNNSPSVEIILDKPMEITGWIKQTSNPNDDNVGLWAATDKVPLTWSYKINVGP